MKNKKVQESIDAIDATMKIVYATSDEESIKQMQLFYSLISVVIEYAQNKLDEENKKDVIDKVDNIFNSKQIQ